MSNTEYTNRHELARRIERNVRTYLSQEPTLKLKGEKPISKAAASVQEMDRIFGR
jgi:hypothetical protein